MDRDFYSFVRLSDLGARPLTVRVASLQGKLRRADRVGLLESPDERWRGRYNDREWADLKVKVQLFADNKPLSLAQTTSYRPAKNGFRFQETITIPYPHNALPITAQLCFTIYECARGGTEVVVGGTTFKLFGKKGTLKKASHRLYVWQGQPADPSAESGTPSKVAGTSTAKLDEMGRLEKLIKMHEASALPRLSWLDKLAYRRIEAINAEESATSSDLFLYIDLPRFEFPVVYNEAREEDEASAAAGELGTQRPGGSVTGTSTTAGAGSSAHRTPAGLSLEESFFTVFDAEVALSQARRGADDAALLGRGATFDDAPAGPSHAAPLFDNLVEAKSRRLARSHRTGPLDRELKPNAGVRDEINDILAYPPTRALTTREADLIWSFRFYLSRFAPGLTKFLKSVSWSDAGEGKQATEVLLPMWAEIGIDDALELLGPGAAFRHRRVRAHAVARLEKAHDEELVLYLLQLVQALKFEDRSQTSSGASKSAPSAGPLPASSSSAAAASEGSASADDAGLKEFLFRRAATSATPMLANNLYWYLTVESADARWGKLFGGMRDAFMSRLRETESGRQRHDLFQRQTTFIGALAELARGLRTSKDARPKKIEKLRAALGDARSALTPFEPALNLPLDTRVRVKRIVAEKSSVFKSNLFPMLLHFETEAGEGGDDGDVVVAERPDDVAPPPSYSVIFKDGDDLRQDQLVMQLFTLMDQLLRNEGLDLCMTPYRVLATAPSAGMVQFVESSPVASILSQHGGSLLNYLRHHRPAPRSTATYGVEPRAFDTYIRSCAGYCVVTYLLGIGDRHLDNLLLAPSGHFFHVDFGYMLGRDPKPFPPPVKVSREMVEAMGGAQSAHAATFRRLACTAFLSLRAKANLILNLVALMVDANVPDIRSEPDRAVQKVQEKFVLGVSDEEAIRYFDELLSENNVLAGMLDRAHDLVQFFRS